jgi:putative dehydrogenase
MSTMANPATAIIGLGAMGIGMAANIIRTGIALNGYDLSGTQRDAFRHLGGTVHMSPATAAAGASLLIIMVVNAEQVCEVLFGDEGALHALGEDACVMLCSTIAPDDVRAIAAKLAEESVMMLDAPVSGGKTGADFGELSIMAAGPKSAFARAQPVLEAISKRVYRLGDDAGEGATYKIVHQLAAGVHLAVAAELLALGKAAGCDAELLSDVMQTSAGRSWMMLDRLPRMIESDFVARSAIDIFVKDLELVSRLGDETGLRLPVTNCALDRFREAQQLGFGRLDDSALVKIYEREDSTRDHETD